ncbi:MAG: hypothetical protein PVI50_02725 [Gammaproteobacteria bacterium]|jgi:hypothetical protein
MSWIMALGWAPGASAQSGYFSSSPPVSPTTQACSSCHTSSDFPSGTCAACHAHGTHPNSNKNTLNVTATPDQATYLPGEAMMVTVTGGYRNGSARAKLWDKDCSSVACSSQDYVVGKGNLLNGQNAPFGGNTTTTLDWTAPTAPGTYTWSASWYGNIYDESERGGGTTFGALWLADPGNGPGTGDPTWPAHGDEIVTFTFVVQGPTNTPPVPVNDSGISTAANTPIDLDVVANDNDADGDTLFVNADYDTASANAGAVVCDTSATTPTPQCNYSPARDFCGSDNFTYRAFDGTDPSANRATVSIQVGDSTPPVVTAPTPDPLVITLPAGTPTSTTVPATDPAIAAWLASAAATDPQDGTVPVANNAPADFPVGTTVVTFTATDVCGNTGAAQASVVIEIAGNSIPVVTAPAPLAVTAPLCATSVPRTDAAIAAWLGAATATDAEDGPLPVTSDAPVAFPLGATLVTFSATDSLGATGTDTSTLTVNATPNTAPVVNAPAPLHRTVPTGTTSVPATDPVIAAWLNAVTASDNEDGPLSVSDDAPADFPLGTTTVTFSATDACGVTSTATSTVTITEQPPLVNNPPQLTVPAPLTVAGALCSTSIPASDPAIAAWLGSATATDIEDGDLTGAITDNAPTNFPASMAPGTATSVTFSVTDSGVPTGTPATTTATSTLTAVDPNTAPTVTAPAPLAITVPAGTTTVPATDPAIAGWLAPASASDGEDGSLNVTNDAPVDFPLGTTTVTFTATDSCGVSDTATSTVTITEQAAVDVWLSRLQTPKKVNSRVGNPTTRSITVRGDGDTITQDAPVTLSVLSAPPNVTLTVTPASLTNVLEPGNPETQFRPFIATFDCTAGGSGTVTWEASIDAPQNSDSTNDILTATSSVTCR